MGPWPSLGSGLVWWPQMEEEKEGEGTDWGGWERKVGNRGMEEGGPPLATLDIKVQEADLLAISATPPAEQSLIGEMERLQPARERERG